MAQMELTLAALRQLDFGKCELAFAKDLERAVLDCMDRPGESKPRVVQLVFKIIPRSSDPETNDCDRVHIQAEIVCTVPRRRSRVYEMMPNVRGKLLFNPDTPTDANGQTLFDDQEKTDQAGE